MILQFSKTTILSIVALMFAAALVYAAQTNAASFGFDKNTDNRKNADAEGVAECMQSCQGMLAGWLEMNSDSKNYDRQKEKIAAKAEQCLAMNNVLADSPFSEDDTLRCGLALRCVELSPDIPIHFGACGDISFIKEANLPQCCSIERGLHEVKGCGDDAEWVVGFTIAPICFVPNS